MKNKMKIMLILMLFMLPFSVKAEEVNANMVLSCDKTKLAPSAITTCTLKVNVTKGVIYDIDTKVQFSNNLSLDGEIEISADMIGSAEDNHITVYPEDALGHDGMIDIATFKVKGSSVTNGSNENIKVIDSEVTYEQNNGLTKTLSDVTYDVRISSNVNTLSNLTLSSGTLSPAFSSNTINYSATVNSDKVTIGATKTDNNSTVSGNVEEVRLNYGVNTFKVNVVSESGVTKTYTISITRPDNRSKTNDLLSFEFFNYSLNFDKNNTDYNLSVENDIKSLAYCLEDKIEGLLCLNSEKIEHNGESISFDVNGSKISKIDMNSSGYVELGDLKEGENVLKISIVAENESVKTYVFNINRKSAVVEGNTENPGTDNGSGDDTNGSGDNSNNMLDKSPTTGSLTLYIVIIGIIVSIGLGVYFYNKYQKKQEKNDYEKK